MQNKVITLFIILALTQATEWHYELQAISMPEDVESPLIDVRAPVFY